MLILVLMSPILALLILVALILAEIISPKPLLEWLGEEVDFFWEIMGWGNDV